jgi:hypothetical protein
MIETELFARWPYDQALSWMINTQSRVERDPHLVVVGVGSHQEPVITLGKNPLTSIIHQEKLSKRPEVIIRAIFQRRSINAKLPYLSPSFVIVVLDTRIHAVPHKLDTRVKPEYDKSAFIDRL